MEMEIIALNSDHINHSFILVMSHHSFYIKK